MDEHGYDYAARVRVATLMCRPQTGASINEPNPVEVAEEEERPIHMLDLSIGCESAMDVDEW